MPGLDELWNWVRTPVQELVSRRASGPDRPWEELRSYFVERTAVGDASNHPLVGTLVRQLDEMPESERNALLDDGDKLESYVYGVATSVAEPARTTAGAAVPARPYDEAAWQRFLTENGPRWPGDEASWKQFRDWFAYQANQSGVGQPATALLDHLDTLGVAERITTLARYGVRIAAQAPTAAEQAPVELTEKDIQSILDQATGFDDIPEDRRRELIHEIAEGH